MATVIFNPIVVIITAEMQLTEFLFVQCCLLTVAIWFLKVQREHLVN